ncbi:MAG: hypothetical protein LH467_03860 [Gemmatimonadaceae bacterium]|nr:hypothetical protein [Gemmatimonadaceae bacterium]
MPDLHDVLVVSHTHWDREWYLPAERFRQRLVALIDELLDDPAGPGESFLLDGQAVLLDDYLDVRPERAAELSVLLRDGRLDAGPWYVLADELIPSGEALVRNLLAGRETMRRLRATPPAVLYCPDSFGHPAALPMLAREFGCDTVVLWRGYGGARWPAGDTVRWRSPSGREVLLHHLPPDGYEFGGSLSMSPDVAAARWARIFPVLGPRAVTGIALLLNGADHHARQRHQHQALAALAVAAAPIRVRSASLGDAMSEFVASASAMDLPVIRGELRDSYGYCWTLQGTLASRAMQKRRNALVEALLVRDVEPWLALLSGNEDGGQRALLRTAWRSLLLAHPHDTLCGTSIDEVAHAMDARMRSAEVQGAGLRHDALLAHVGHDRERARAVDSAAWRPAVLLRNASPRARGGVAHLTLTATLADVAVGPGSGERQSSARRVPPWRVEGIPLQLLQRVGGIELTESPRAYPDADQVVRVQALGWVDSIAGYGIATRAQSGGKRGPRRPGRIEVRNAVRADGLTLDNGLVRISVDERGIVQLLDLLTGRAIDRLVTLEQTSEAGDLYTPGPRQSLPAPTVRRVQLVHRGPLRGEIAIDVDLSAPKAGRRGRCRIALQLDADLPAVRIAIDGDNRAGDHRVRLRLASALAGATTLADAAFHPVARVPLTISDAEERTEHLVPTAPLHRWVTRFTPRTGVTVISDGLAEYESLDDGAVAITLLRAVGVLSRADLLERPGHAGWPADTPAAQSIGPFAARFALAVHGPDSPAQRDAIHALADDVLHPIVGETLRSNLLENVECGGLELYGDGLTFSAAAPAQREGWIVLRCVNQRDAPVRGRWTLNRPVREAVRSRLDETPLDSLDVDGHSVSFDAVPFDVVTVLLR